MKAIDELRHLLDELDVKWDVFKVRGTEYIHWTNNDDLWCAASVGELSKLHVNILNATPKQAIAATLGGGKLTTDMAEKVKELRLVSLKFPPNIRRKVNIALDGIEQTIIATLERGTCELVNAANDLGDGTLSFMCNSCGYTALDDWWDEFNYCPNCGAEVIN